MNRLLMSTLIGVPCLVAVLLPFRQAPAASQDNAVRMPAEGMSLRIQLGLKDKEPSAWDGRLSLSEGQVLDIEVSPPRAGSAEPSSWKARTLPPAKPKPAAKSVHDPKLPRLVQPVLTITVEAPRTAKATVTTPQGEFAFALADLLAAPLIALEGQVRVEGKPLSIRLTAGPEDEDWPAAARTPDGTLWMAYTAYQHAEPVDDAAVHFQKQFDGLKATGNGDQVRLMKFDGSLWSPPVNLTATGVDVWRPSVAVDSQGTVWVIYSQNVDGNWDLYAVRYEPGSQETVPAIRLTEHPGADLEPVVVVDPQRGRLFVVWQGWRDGDFDILFRPIGDGADQRSQSETQLSDSPANDWWPAAALDSQGELVVAYDTYDRGTYDVKLVVNANGPQPRALDVAATPLYEARPSIAVDQTNRVWVAYEEAGQNWGKDFGMRWRGPTGEDLYWSREIVVRCVEGKTVRQAAGVVPCEPIARNYPDAQTRRMSCPRLAIDGRGHVWLAYRRHPDSTGGGEVWTSWVTHHTGTNWAEPVRLANTENLMDNRPAVIPLQTGGVLLVHSTDGRTSGTGTAKHNDLFCTRMPGDGTAAGPELADLPPSAKPAPVHPNEDRDLQRIRDYRATVGGKTYRLLRGEFHRHTELTSHRDMDGTIEDMFRYGLDAARMEWIGNGDHDNGNGIEYLWWLVQKRTDMYHHAPQFLPMFTYERSVSYPSGHRNAMFVQRGIRPLPRLAGGQGALYGTPEEGSPDIKLFYAYLRHFGGICASHTSGTGMGTDWRDNDPEVEPIVEIYQGLRHSYEHEGAPATAIGAEDAIGGYQPAGFIWNALQKGYRLGFQSSSDHYSSHISYAIVWAEEATRAGLLDGFKRRHCYAANDNIILDVRCGERMMGDIFTTGRKPTLEISVIGTGPIARLSVIRGVGREAPQYVYDAKLGEPQVKLSWTDEAAPAGQTSYYYVRVEQTPPGSGYGALAWSSPMWITLEK